MTRVYTEQVRDALRELSDVEFQKRVWTGPGDHGMESSFSEAVERLYDDSVLGDALDRGKSVFGSAVDDELRHLEALLRKVDQNICREEDIVNDGAMRAVRDLAAVVLRAIEEQGTEGPAL